MNINTYNELFLYLTAHQYPDKFKSCKENEAKNAKRGFRSKAKAFIIRDGILYHNDRQVLQENQVKNVMKALHDSSISGGHLGRDKLMKKLHDRYWWKGMKEDALNYIKTCDKCSRFNVKSRLEAPPLHPIPVPSKVWSLVTIDLIGPLPTSLSGNNYIVAATDHFSKWSEAQAIPTKSAENVANFLLDCVCRLGCMDTVDSDQGREFVNVVITILMKKLDVA